MKSNLPLCLKKKVFNQCILPTMSYAAETWTLSKIIKSKLAVPQRAMEKVMIGISRRNKWRNNEIRQRIKVKDTIIKVKELKWQWT